MTERTWVLGAPDPEMAAIESLLRECGERVAYAMSGGRRVTPATAYRATEVQCADDCAPSGTTSEWYLVECGAPTPAGARRVIIDHHRPGDPGFGRPPSEFLAASSIGQVVTELARLDLWPPPGDGCGRDWTPTNCRPMWFGESYEDPHGVGWWWIVGEDSGGCCHRLPYALVPHDLILIAAADHCLGAAYRGECPGVDPDELMRWRAESRARFQGRSVGEILADIEATSDALREALGSDPIFLEPTGPECGDPQCSCHLDSIPRVADMRREPPWPELPEAATRLGIGYISGPLETPDGRRKITVSGSPDQVRAFLEYWAPRQGLVDCYGDPERGFAGAYMEEQP